MAALLIKNIPPRLHELLKKRAAANRRSLNNEAILVLEKAMESQPSPAPDSSPPMDLSEDALAALPTDIAGRLRALRSLRESLAARNVDFAAWHQTATDSRR